MKIETYEERYIEALAKCISKRTGLKDQQTFARECVSEVKQVLQEEVISPVEGNFDRLLSQTLATYLNCTIGEGEGITKEARKKSWKSVFTVPYEYENLIGLYEKIALIAGYAAKNVAKMQFDCTKLWVSPSIKDYLFSIMKEKQAVAFEIAEVWLCYGPKTDDSLPQGTVKVEPGFFVFGN